MFLLNALPDQHMACRPFFQFFNLFFPPLLFSVLEAAALGLKDKDVVLSCLSSYPKDSIHPHAHGKRCFAAVDLFCLYARGEKKK